MLVRETAGKGCGKAGLPRARGISGSDDAFLESSTRRASASPSLCVQPTGHLRTHLPGLTWGSLLQRVLRGCRARVGGLATLKRVGRHDVPGQRGKVTLSPGVDLGAWLPLFSLPRTPAQRCEHQGANKMVPLGYLFMVDCLSCPSWDGAPCPPRSLRPAAEAHGGGFQAHV